jgi:hypothetical protein
MGSTIILELAYAFLTAAVMKISAKAEVAVLQQTA